MNEELQATNEELETLNEELQATVEELHATNEDLGARSLQLEDYAARLDQQRRAGERERLLLENVIASIDEMVLVLDQAGAPILANEAYRHVFGERLALPAFQDGDGEPFPDGHAPHELAAQGEDYRVVFTAQLPDGSRRQFEAVRRGSRDGQSERVIVIRPLTG
jgi:two-component system CheB/CheR fusion protein